MIRTQSLKPVTYKQRHSEMHMLCMLQGSDEKRNQKITTTIDMLRLRSDSIQFQRGKTNKTVFWPVCNRNANIMEYILNKIPDMLNIIYKLFHCCKKNCFDKTSLSSITVIYIIYIVNCLFIVQSN